jgi:hypothetical protein
MQPILIHCGEFVTERLIEILDNSGIASVTYSCCRTKPWPGSNAKASVTLKLHRQHSHRHVFASVCVASSALPPSLVSGHVSQYTP